MSKRVMLIDMGSINNESVGVVQAAIGFVIEPSDTKRLSAPYFVHGGRTNLAAFGGNVESVTVDQHWNDYFYYYNGTTGFSVLPQRYFDVNGQLVQPSR